MRRTCSVVRRAWCVVVGTKDTGRCKFRPAASFLQLQFRDAWGGTIESVRTPARTQSSICAGEVFVERLNDGGDAPSKRGRVVATFQHRDETAAGMRIGERQACGRQVGEPVF